MGLGKDITRDGTGRGANQNVHVDTFLSTLCKQLHYYQFSWLGD